jgi:hypothetical protein
MTGSIEIPGYETLIPNSTWGRRAKPIINCSETTQILQLARYTIPTKEEILRFIQYNAEQYTSLGEGGNADEIPLLSFLEQLPFTEILRINGNQKGIMGRLGSHYPRNEFQEGRAYLQFSSGIMPDNVLEEYRGPIEERGALIYSILLDQEGFQSGHFNIRLNGKNTLPGQLEIEALLENGGDLDVLTIGGVYDSIQTVKDWIEFLYSVLDRREKITMVNDNSQDFLETRAAVLLSRTARGIRPENSKTLLYTLNSFSEN